MATLWVTMLLVLSATTLDAGAFSEGFLETNPLDPLMETLPVFQKGNFETKPNTVEKSHPSSPPEPLYIVRPKKAGTYPILLFIHGTKIANSDYGALFEHIASHGFIVVAPQLWHWERRPWWNPILIPVIPSHCKEINMTATVANWLPRNLIKVLPKDVKGNMNMLAVSGHSRGGKTAFALALGTDCSLGLQVKISAIVGLDPVAGPSKSDRTEPYILTYNANSFDLPFPTLVIGTGLGNESNFGIFGPSCAPNEVNHEEFYNEIKIGAHFVVMEYGHVNMVDDNASTSTKFMEYRVCKSGIGPKDHMRRTVGGLFVAYLKYVLLGDQPGDYGKIIDNPSLAPARLAKPNVKPAKKEAGYHSLM